MQYVGWVELEPGRFGQAIPGNEMLTQNGCRWTKTQDSRAMISAGFGGKRPAANGGQGKNNFVTRRANGLVA
ncbi:LOW QUALITY PROTEIN: hypothetical protein HJFPF1_09000 [Paramyrothecium foliicola]|nr:LOW QUALITY PROTEIN: hypothetical protein HJFPF1_09000 [Paramyrothecium foliicola]